MKQNPVCPACESDITIDKGELPGCLPHTFGGNHSRIEMSAGHFLWCPSCDLHFRYPCPDQSTLTSLYQDLPDSVWQSDQPRQPWHQVNNLLAAFCVNKTILDIGCFKGDFLAQLDGSWRKLGVEPSRAARAVAVDRGIELVGNTIEDISESVDQVGIITLLDVLEHLYHPRTTLQRLRRLLAEGGSIIILTGSTDTIHWRLFGRHYWYSALPEHVTFFSLRWFRWVASQLGMKISFAHYLSSHPGACRDSLVQFAKLSLFTTTQCLNRLNLPRQIVSRTPFVRRAMLWKSVPWWTQAKDHVLVVLTAQ